MTHQVSVVSLPFRKLDAAVVVLLRRAFDRAWSGQASVVVLDFANVVDVDSLGLTLLLSEYRRKPHGSHVVVCGLNDRVRDIFEVTGLFRWFAMYTVKEAAVAALAA